MDRKPQHYSSHFPDVKLKRYTISESLRRHLYIFKTLTGVFSYKKIDLGTKILVENMFIPKEPSNLLDLGCGYGIIGIVLAYESPQSAVYMIDINRRALWCAKENVKISLQENQNKVKILSGNYFEPFRKKKIKFDGIYTNPPLRKGKREFLNVCEAVPNFLKDEGFFQFVVKRKMGAESILNELRKRFQDAKIEIIYKRSGYWIFFCQFNR
jgi:16S rRNA (guanine1207-N2)-methyltransferase